MIGIRIILSRALSFFWNEQCGRDHGRASSALENLIARKSRVADGFPAAICAFGRDRSVLRRVLTRLVSFFSSEPGDRDGLPENGRMRLLLRPWDGDHPVL